MSCAEGKRRREEEEEDELESGQGKSRKMDEPAVCSPSNYPLGV